MTQHNFHSSILRAYDIRGRIDDTLSCRDAEFIGRSFGSMVIRDGGHKVSVCRDGRLTSPALTDALINGILSTGLDVVDIGCGPTPLLYYSVFELELDGGIMVTGSHNPIDENGFKLMLGQAAMHGDQIVALGNLAASGDFTQGLGDRSQVDLMARYIARLLQDVDHETLTGAALRVGWDPGHGAGADVVSRLVKHLPGEHFVINGKIDGTFPAHHPDPSIPENLKQLKSLMREKNLDLGFAFDGDGDRVGVIDRNGEIIWGDHMVTLLAREILDRTPGATIIADVKSSQAAFDMIGEMGGIAMIWKTGHSLIKKKMRETGALLAGELSGHIYIKDRFYGFDDGVYVALRLLNVFAGHDKGVMDLLSVYPKLIATPEIRFACSEDRKFEIVPEVLARLNPNTHAILTIDGIRVSCALGWWLLRPSNTQATLVARAEAASRENLESLIAHLNQQLQLSGLEPVKKSAF